MSKLSEQLNACLPQTQCGECGFEGCRPYADAMAKGAATIDKCPPGGINTLDRLGALLNTDPAPYRDHVASKTRQPQLAWIDESRCIGCTKCIQACPVDAIVGTAKRMHTIIESECTGCELCVPACPTDCIELKPIQQYQFDRDVAVARFDARKLRLELQQQQKAKNYEAKKVQRKQDYILQALARVQAKKGPA